mmetsp:Transcript_70354/g.177314  ORF Transcript_70354/g.177314 Transcript_70354/m.177314 type:complete len:83 (+) Transcript_70354:144-392(+)
MTLATLLLDDSPEAQCISNGSSAGMRHACMRRDAVIHRVALTTASATRCVSDSSPSEKEQSEGGAVVFNHSWCGQAPEPAAA